MAVTLPRNDIPLVFVDRSGAVRNNPEWMRALSDLLARAGGTSGTDTQTIYATATEALQRAALAPAPIPPKDVRAGEGVAVTQDAAGFTVSADLWHVLNTVRAFTPRTDPPRPIDDAQALIAARVFARHT